jgi:hypothetical protein
VPVGWVRFRAAPPALASFRAAPGRRRGSPKPSSAPFASFRIGASGRYGRPIPPIAPFGSFRAGLFRSRHAPRAVRFTTWSGWRWWTARGACLLRGADHRDSLARLPNPPFGSFRAAPGPPRRIAPPPSCQGARIEQSSRIYYTTRFRP